jgi:hypothetical protein
VLLQYVNLVPFAGIAFLWFIGVIRDRVGQREDRFFATVFLGSGLLFVAMLFVGTAVAGGLFAAASRPSGPPGADTLTLGRDVTAILVNIYSMRMAAVFTLTTVTIARRTQIVSRWLTVAGIAAALVLLVGVGISAWAELLFPAWILALSIDILTASRESPRAARERPLELIARGRRAGHSPPGSGAPPSWRSRGSWRTGASHLRSRQVTRPACSVLPPTRERARRTPSNERQMPRRLAFVAHARSVDILHRYARARLLSVMV